MKKRFINFMLAIMMIFNIVGNSLVVFAEKETGDIEITGITILNKERVNSYEDNLFLIDDFIEKNNRIKFKLEIKGSKSEEELKEYIEGIESLNLIRKSDNKTIPIKNGLVMDLQPEDGFKKMDKVLNKAMVGNYKMGILSLKENETNEGNVESDKTEKIKELEGKIKEKFILKEIEDIKVEEISINNYKKLEGKINEIEKEIKALKESGIVFSNEKYNQIKEKYEKVKGEAQVINDTIEKAKDIINKTRDIERSISYYEDVQELKNDVEEVRKLIDELAIDELTEDLKEKVKEQDRIIKELESDINKIDEIIKGLKYLLENEEEITKDNYERYKGKLEDIDKIIEGLSNEVFKKFYDVYKLNRVRNKIQSIELEIAEDKIELLKDPEAIGLGLSEEEILKIKEEIKEIEEILDRIPGYEGKINRELEEKLKEVKEKISLVEDKRESNIKIEEINGEKVITIKMSDSAKKALAYGTEFENCENRQTAAGFYSLELKFKDGSIKKIDTIKIHLNDDKTTGPFKELIIKDKPWVESVYPKAGEKRFNPADMYESFTNEDGRKEEGYYLRVKFNNLGGNLKLAPVSNISGINVRIKGESINIVDSTKSLHLKASTLYIPLRERPKDGNTYEVSIPANGLVEYGEFRTGNDGFDRQNNGYKNRCYSWEFGIDIAPKGERLYEGSIVEDYDTSYPIIIDVINVTSDTEVFFRGDDGRSYDPDDVKIRYGEEEGQARLEIYLPRRRKLRVGQYDIILRNAKDFESEMKYGVLSVVEEGREVPREDYWTREKDYYGDVRAKRGTSSDVLQLRKSDRNAYSLDIDLDEIMGVDSWSRSIEYPAYYGDVINHLKLRSVWADIEIWNLRKGYENAGEDLKLKVGRASPVSVQNLKSHLKGMGIRSNFIEVQGENLSFDSVTVSIPYENSDGNRLKMMMYDEMSRRFMEIQSNVDRASKKVTAKSLTPGIFVVVE